MKRILYFIFLKVIEIGGVSAVYYGLCQVWYWIAILLGSSAKTNDLLFWFGGTMTICVLILFGLCIVGVIQLVKANWRKAGELAERGKK